MKNQYQNLKAFIPNTFYLWLITQCYVTTSSYNFQDFLALFPFDSQVDFMYMSCVQMY